MTANPLPTIGIIGGTGPEGRGLAVRWALAGYPLEIGSRSPERAADAALQVKSIVPTAGISGADNSACAGHCDIAVISVPLAAVKDTVAPVAPDLAGKLVVSVVAALDWVEGRPRPVHLTEGSAAQLIQSLLPKSQVTSAFQTLSAEELANPDRSMNEDCLICGDDKSARDRTIELARAISGVRAMSAGRLENSYYPEVLVGLLATVNRIHKVHAGIRLTGFRDSESS